MSVNLTRLIERIDGKRNELAPSAIPTAIREPT